MVECGYLNKESVIPAKLLKLHVPDDCACFAWLLALPL